MKFLKAFFTRFICSNEQLRIQALPTIFKKVYVCLYLKVFNLRTFQGYKYEYVVRRKRKQMLIDLCHLTYQVIAVVNNSSSNTFL